MAGETIKAYKNSIADLTSRQTLWGVVGALSRRVDDNIQAIKGQAQLSKDILTRIDNLVSRLRGLEDEIKNATKGQKGLADALSDIWNLRGDWYSSLVQNIKSSLDYNTLSERVKALVDTVSDNVKNISQIADEIISLDTVHDFITCFAEGVREKVQKYLSDVQTVWGDLENKAKEVRRAVSNVADGWKSSVDHFINRTETAVSSVESRLLNIKNDVATAVRGFREVMRDGFKEGGKIFEVRRNVSKWEYQAYYHKKIVLGRYANPDGSTKEYSVDVVMGPWKWDRAEELTTADLAEFLKNWFPDYVKGVADVLRGILEMVVDRVRAVVSDFLAEIKDSYSKISSSVGDVSDSVKSTISRFKLAPLPTDWTSDDGKPEFDLTRNIKGCLGKVEG